MGQLTDFDVSVSNGLGVFLAVPFLIYYAWQLYRPAPDGRVPGWLFPVRLLAMMLMAALLLEPVAAVTYQATREPLLAVLLDDSASMRIEGAGISRSALARSLMESPEIKALEGKARIQAYRFSDSLVVDDPSLADSVRWQGRATNIADALDGLAEETAGQGLVGVLLLTDGGHNLGRQPARAAAELGVPVYPVGLGDPTPPRDVALESGTVDPVAYVGQELELSARVVSNGYDGIPLTVVVEEVGGEAARRLVTLQDGEQQVDFTVRPTEAGRQVYRLSVPPQPGEHSEENNVLLLSTDVLEGRRRVFIAAGRPSADLAYLRRLLESDPNTEVEAWVYVRSGIWTAGAPQALSHPAGYDLVILVDVPGKVLQGPVGQSLQSYVQNGGALLVVGGANALDRSYYGSDLVNVLPVAILPDATWRESSVSLKVADGALEHPVLRRVDPLSDQESWAELPPVLAFNRTGSLQRGAEALLVHPVERVGGHPMPLAAVRRFGQGRTMVMAARTFSRLGVMMWGIGKAGDVSQAFWLAAVKWLVAREDVARVQTSTDKGMYRSGEPVRVLAQVFTELMEPADGAGVVAVLKNGERERRVALVGQGQGRYSGIVGGFSQGDYAYEIKVADGAGEAEGRFTVGRYSVELEDVQMNEELLHDVASRSGGVFLTDRTAPAFIDSMILSEQPVSGVYRARLWGSHWPLYLLVALFTAEWIVRRKRGMV